MKDDRLYLAHIRDCINQIGDYTREGEKAFRSSRLIQDAVLRNLQTLAESTKRLSAALKKANPDIAWRDIKGLRNILVHDYLGVDLDVVWIIVARDLPALNPQIDRLLGVSVKPSSKKKPQKQKNPQERGRARRGTSKE
jgi:uncharacterized protein with HEPN domain